MKIGVITWFRDMNYGTVLQAFALQQFLIEKGYSPAIINYIVQSQSKKSKRNIVEKIKGKIEYWLNGNFGTKFSSEFDVKAKSFYDLIDSKCVVTDKVVSDEDFIQLNDQFDAFICGSDQIWNPNWLNGRYFLNFVNSDKIKIAYAPSMGISKIDAVSGAQIADYLKSFSAISLREIQAIDMLKKYCDKDISLVCDPVFLLDKGYWENLAAGEYPSEKYVLVYFLTFQPEHWKAVKAYAKQNNLSIILIPVYGKEFYLNGCEKYPFASPLQFINLIKHAEIVITDSFHGLAFSILLNKQFYIFERFSESNSKSQNSRIINLLSIFELENNKIDFKDKKIPINTPVDYSKVNLTLEKLRTSSKKFLLNALENSEQ